MNLKKEASNEDGHIDTFYVIRHIIDNFKKFHNTMYHVNRTHKENFNIL